MCIINAPEYTTLRTNIVKLSEDYNPGTYIIRSYADNKVEVNNSTYESSLIISNTKLITDWEINNIEKMTHDHWLSLIEPGPEVILIGTGSSLVFPHPSTYRPAIEKGIGVEFMDSGAACRTYNILLSEDRFVIAGIIL